MIHATKNLLLMIPLLTATPSSALAYEAHPLPPLRRPTVLPSAEIARLQRLAEAEAAERLRLKPAHALWGPRNFLEALIRVKGLDASSQLDHELLMEGADPRYSRDEAGFRAWTIDNVENAPALELIRARLLALADAAIAATPARELDFAEQDQAQRLIEGLAERLSH